jgi:Undecaprenyl-phosphate galactose phosphotransferase WbaP
MILGGGEQGEMVVNLLQRNPELGLRPVLVLSNGTADKRDIRGVPVNDGFDLVERLGKDLGIRHAILAMPGLTRIELLDILKTHCQTLPHIFLIPDLSGVSSLWLQATDVAGVLAFQLQHRLLMPSALFVKRAIDLSLIAIGSIPVLPLVGFVALLVKVTSRGPIFYGHSRIGKGGVSFRAWKFRSMVVDSDRVLSNHLEEVPSARAEWEANQKLRHDPRVTWLGRILRKTSLDELPQLFNVFQGEMSLVGPRPIVEKEVVRYGDAMDLYQKVTPGITGLWQVSGRNNTSYAERVAWDEYYVRNWSAWLDFHILLRTVEVVLRREGAM